VIKSETMAQHLVAAAVKHRGQCGINLTSGEGGRLGYAVLRGESKKRVI